MPVLAIVRMRFAALSERLTVPPRVVPPVLVTFSVLLPRLLVTAPFKVRAEVPPMVLLAASVMVFPKVLAPLAPCRVPPLKDSVPVPRAVLLPAAMVPAVNVVPPE